MVYTSRDLKHWMVLHRPFGARARGRLYGTDNSGDVLRIVRQRTDLDGDIAPTR